MVADVYVGRFAPSPTGPLHTGSLFTAVASYLDARCHGGEWLVRIDDIDPPREAAGATAVILRVLDAFDLHWDRAVLYQSSRVPAYAEVAETLLASGAAFRCSCSRADLRGAQKGVLDGDVHAALGPMRRYPGTCRTYQAHAGPTSIRVRVDDPAAERVAFHDALRGVIGWQALHASGDYVIWRRDGLPAYHLAAVVDDAWQGVTHIVRGRDLLGATVIHRHLQTLLACPVPRYAHLPLVTNPTGAKLSKQTGAAAVERQEAAAVAAEILGWLGLVVPNALRGARPRELWDWALGHWNLAALAGSPDIIAAPQLRLCRQAS